MTLRGQLGRLLGRTRRTAPTLSVVVPVHDAADYLDDALASLRAQPLTDLQVVLVDYGSQDGSAQILARAAAADDRLTVLHQPHRGPGAARNLALRHATGRYVTFMDADDLIPPHAYELMVDTLERTGSDFVIGAVRRFHSEREWRPHWVRAAHARPLDGATLETCPDAMLDILACDRLYRREFWDRQVGGFPEGVVYEDHVPMLRAYLHGARFDVLTEVTYLWRQNATGTSQQKADLQNLLDRAQAKDDAWRLLTVEGTELERRLWLARVLDLDLPLYHRLAVDASDEYRDVLRRTVTTYLEPARESGALDRVNAPHTVAAWLVAHGDWEALDRLVAPGAAPVLAVLDGGVARLPARPVATDAPDLPDDLRAVSASESRLSARVLRTRWRPDGSLDVELAARVHGVHVPADDVVCTIVATEPDGRAHRFPASVDPSVRTGGARSPRGTTLGVRAQIDPAAAAQGPTPPDVDLTVEVHVGEWSRTAPLVVAPGSGASHRPSTLRPGTPARVAALTTTKELPDGLGLRFFDAPATLVSAHSTPDGATLEVRATGEPDGVTAVRARSGDVRTPAAPLDGAWRLPPLGDGTWVIEAQVAQRWVRVRADDATAALLVDPLRPGPRSTVRVLVPAPPLLLALGTSPDALLLTCSSDDREHPGKTAVPIAELRARLTRAEEVERNPFDAAPTTALTDPSGTPLAVSPVLAAELPVTIEHDDLTFELHTRRGLAHVTTRRRTPGAPTPGTPPAGTDD